MSGPIASGVTANVVFDNLNLGLIVLDKDFNILLWNGWMERHSGIEAALTKMKYRMSSLPSVV